MLRTTVLIWLCATLFACANENLTTPCPDFGARCTKTPINTWEH